MSEIKELPERMTIGECYHPAMRCETQEEADAWFEALVQRDMRYHGKSREEAESIQRHNIGYFSGYFDSERAARTMRLFKTSHPIFGMACPTAEEALEAGKKAAK